MSEQAHTPGRHPFNIEAIRAAGHGKMADFDYVDWAGIADDYTELRRARGDAGGQP